MAKFILVVDDSREMREFLTEVVFRPEGYQVVAVPCVEDALDVIDRHMPDLIITDFNMPGMSGLDMLDALRSKGVTTPIILITATGSEETAIRAFRSGIVDYFIKPFDPMALMECAKETMAAASRDTAVVAPEPSKGIFDFERVMTIGKKITSLRNFNQILERILEAAVYLTGAGEGSITLLSGPGSQPDKAVRFDPNTGHSPALPITSREIIEAGAPVLLTADASGAPIVRAIHTPLVFRDDRLGILSVLAENIGDEQQRFISSLADYAAMAMHNARLYESAEQDRKKLSSLISNLREPIILLDSQDRVLLMNPSAFRLFDVGENDIARQPQADTILKDRNILNYLLKSTSMPTWEDEYFSEDGRAYRMKTTQIDRVGRALILHDITEVKAIEQLKDDFISGLSHELRSPLTSILSYTDLLEEAGPLNPQQRKFTEQVKDSVETITLRLNEITAASRTETARAIEHQVLLVQDLIRSSIMAIRPEAERKSIKLSYSVVEEPVQVLGDIRLLRQALLHLLDNAVKFSEPGDEVIVSTQLDKVQVLIRVMDNGIGISEAEQGRLFKKYYRSKSDDTPRAPSGIGLEFVQSTIESHEGRIWVESQPGQGSIFSILLPLYEG